MSRGVGVALTWWRSVLLAGAVVAATSIGLSSAQAVAPYGWSGPQSVDPPHGTPTSISCASSTFCAAVDAQGTAFVDHSGTWSAGVRVDHTALGLRYPRSLTSVSCATSLFCAAVDIDGYATTYNGASWSAPRAVDITRNLDSVSCPSATFCVAVDDFGYAITWNGQAWSAPALIDNSGQNAGAQRYVSCSSATFCAVLTSGKVITFNGHSWSAPSPVGIGPIVYGISCASPAFCVAEGLNGFSGAGATIYNGTSWSTPSSVGAGDTVSCASVSFCAVGDGFGAVSTYNGTSWTSPHDIAYGLHSISCPSASFCAVSGVADTVMVGTLGVQDNGAVYTYDGAAWSDPIAFDPGGGGGGGVSCPSTTFCAAVAPGMDASIYRSGSWSFDSYIDNLDVFTAPSVSCATVTFCMAVNPSGDALIFNGTKWSAPEPVDANRGLTGVSCATSTFCVAVSSAGDALVYRSGSWSLPTSVDPSGLGFESISCPTTTFCAAIDYQGHAMTYNGTSWASPANATTGGVGSISCPTPTFCAAVAGGAAAIYTSGHWPSPAIIAVSVYTMSAVSCPSASYCVAIDSGGYAHTYNGHAWTTSPHIAIAGIVVAMSCPTTNFCQAIDDLGQAYTWGGKLPLPARISGPTISGTARVGHTLTCHATYLRATSIQYQWKRNAITVARAGATYRSVGADYKAHVTCTAQARNSSGQSPVSSSRSVLVGQGARLAVHTAPRVSGTLHVGRKLSAHPGSWAPSATSYSYQWLVSGKAVRRATHQTFTVASADNGRTISVRVTAHRYGYANGSATSRAVRVV